MTTTYKWKCDNVQDSVAMIKICLVKFNKKKVNKQKKLFSNENHSIFKKIIAKIKSELKKKK